MSEFVHVDIPRFLTSFRSEIENLRDEIVQASIPIIRREEVASIKARWYRTGETLRSLQEETITIGNSRVYRLFPTARHSVFGEYGTGRRGAVSGRPVPRGWRYGPKPGMTARRFSRIAVQNARPQVVRVAESRAKVFARNVTIN